MLNLIFKVIGGALSLVVTIAVILLAVAVGRLAFTDCTAARMALTPWFFVKIDKGQEPVSAFLSQMQKEGWSVSSQDSEKIVLAKDGEDMEVYEKDILAAIIDDKLFIFESCQPK